MSVNPKSTRRLLGLLAGLGAVTVAGAAQAATVQLSTGVLLVKESSNAPVKRGTGAGILMPRLEQLNGNKLMAIWMDSAPDSVVPQSNAGDNNGYWEGKVAVVQMNAEAAPTVTSMQQFTNFSGDRPYNHGRLASAGNYVVVNFASTMDDPNTTNQYVMVLDSTGKPASQPLDVGLNDGNNHGAAEIAYMGKDSSGVDHFLGGFLHNNNETYTFGLSVSTDANGDYQVNRDWLTEIVRPANIGRPTCAVTSTTTATCCAAKGNNRPPEIGVQCAVLDTTTGNITNKVLRRSLRRTRTTRST